MSSRRSKWRTFLVIALILAFGGAAVLALPAVAPSLTETPRPMPAEWPKVQARLDRFDKAADAALVKRLEMVKTFFDQRKYGAQGFAEEALSWGGKWEFIKDTLGAGNHRKYLAEALARNTFTVDELRAVLEAAIKGYLTDLDGLENELLVQLRADLADSELGRGTLRPYVASDKAFQSEYRKLALVALPVVADDMNITLSREMLGFIAMDVGTQAVVRIGTVTVGELGLEGGILGSGAVVGIGTLGVGLIIGFIVDAVLDDLLRIIGYDPQREIARHVCGALDEMRALLVDGDTRARSTHEKLCKLASDDWWEDVRTASRRAADRIERGGRLGLRWELQRIQQVRARLRQEALRKLLLKGVES
jgi:hypothetical protein